jgi:hypothetical protein
MYFTNNVLAKNANVFVNVIPETADICRFGVTTGTFVVSNLMMNGLDVNFKAYRITCSIVTIYNAEISLSCLSDKQL